MWKCVPYLQLLGIIRSKKRMEKEILYVEKTNGFNHDEEAWIGYGFFNRTRKTIYFNGRILGKGRGTVGNFVDIDSGEEFWVSGVKKNGQDRHWAGKGKIYIDESVIQDYMDHTNTTTLSKSKFTTIKFDNEPKVELGYLIENKSEEKD